VILCWANKGFSRAKVMQFTRCHYCASLFLSLCWLSFRQAVVINVSKDMEPYLTYKIVIMYVLCCVCFRLEVYINLYKTWLAYSLKLGRDFRRVKIKKKSWVPCPVTMSSVARKSSMAQGQHKEKFSSP
jgi:hypothetical protein